MIKWGVSKSDGDLGEMTMVHGCIKPWRLGLDLPRSSDPGSTWHIAPEYHGKTTARADGASSSVDLEQGIRDLAMGSTLGYP